MTMFWLPVLTSWRFAWVTPQDCFLLCSVVFAVAKLRLNGSPSYKLFYDMFSVVWKNFGTVIKPMRSPCVPLQSEVLPPWRYLLSTSPYLTTIPLQCLNNWKMDRQAMWDKFSNKVNGGSMKATGHNATTYYHVPDLKRRVVNLSPTLGKTQKWAQKLISFVYYVPGDRLETWVKPTEEEREERKGKASKEVSLNNVHRVSLSITNLGEQSI